MIAAHVKDQLVVKGWVFATLILGFLVSVAIPRLAIIKLGETGYGVYALVVGFAGVLAFADLGLIPGLTRGLAKPLARGDRIHIDAVLKKMDRLTLAILVCLAPSCAVLMSWSMPGIDQNALHALVVFAVATFYGIRAEIRATLLRASGAVALSYVLRGVYLLCYLSVVGILFFSIKMWSGVWLICYAQLLASIIYYLLVMLSLNRILPTSPPATAEFVDHRTGFWVEAWRVSSPERLNRSLQLVAGAVERPLLVATAGFAVVSSYDLMMRLMLLISAIPGALSQPLLAMLVHDSVRAPSARRFPVALRLTKIVGAIFSFVGLVVAMVLWNFFHQWLFGLPSLISPGVAFLVAVVTAVNVLTAPGSAALTATGAVRANNLKIYTEAIGVVLGCVIAWWLKNGLLFIIIRNIALGLSAIGFLVAENFLFERAK